MWRKLESDESGFTLVEILAVLVIAAILTVTSLPVMAGSIDKAKKYRYLEEARLAAEGLQYLVVLEHAAGTYDFFELAAEVHQSFDNEDNRLGILLKGNVTPGARIEEIAMDSDEVTVTAITYRIKSLRIDLNLEYNTVTFR